MAEQLTFYVELEGDGQESAQQLEAMIRGLEDVTEVEAHAEEPERGALEIVQSVTLTVTALGGAVTAAGMLVDQIKALLTKFSVRSAQMETAEGLRELVVGAAPIKENPAQ